jgi:hypothetical protein
MHITGEGGWDTLMAQNLNVIEEQLKGKKELLENFQKHYRCEDC